MNSLYAQTLTAFVWEGKVYICFRMGLADGYTLLSRRSTEGEFAEIADDEPTPVIDARPKLDPHRPEVRVYRAVLRSSGHEFRQFSNEVVLTVP